MKQRVKRIINDSIENFEEKVIEIINEADLCPATKKLLIFLLFCLTWTFIFVNNGNILSDGRDERRYLQRKYNKM